MPLEKPTLEGNKVTLRPITKADAEAMFAGFSGEGKMQLTGTQQTSTSE